ncbi:MAG: CDF family Co(II)/Ni(II) efflux transporter DmeF [Halioglobus sp.]
MSKTRIAQGDPLANWRHDHVFEQDHKRAGESRTLLVVGVTTVMMVVEIVAGLLYGSMALLADGLHMASHAAALGIAVLAYVVSRRLAKDPRFAFGVGKINSLAGFTSAVLLLGFALLMMTESVDRLLNPLAIDFDQALWVASAGLAVNGACAWILVSTPHEHGHGHHHGDHHDDDHEDHHEQHHDHNLRAAYLHVLADALTSVLAIIALLAGKYYGANWLDPMMGIVGAILVTRWSWGLIRDTAKVLLDRQADGRQTELLRQSIETGSAARVTDLHYWTIGHGIYAAELVIVSSEPATPAYYRSLIPAHLNLVHVTIEVHQLGGS